jgi:hypothetical protein
MSVKVMTDVWQHAELSSGDLVVALAIADMADDEHRSCWPSVPYLAWKCRMSDRGVQKVFQHLGRKGVLTVTLRTGHSSIYHINEVVNFVHPRTSFGVNPSSPGGEPQFTTDGEPQFTQNHQVESSQESSEDTHTPPNEPDSEPASTGEASPRTRSGSPPGPGARQNGEGTALPAVPVLFERFWAAYPRPGCRGRVGKSAARKAWDKLQPDEALIEAMLAALAWQRDLPDWGRDDGRYVPHPATWLNGRRWEDEQPEVDLLRREPERTQQRMRAAKDAIEFIRHRDEGMRHDH